MKHSQRILQQIRELQNYADGLGLEDVAAGLEKVLNAYTSEAQSTAEAKDLVDSTIRSDKRDFDA